VSGLASLSILALVALLYLHLLGSPIAHLGDIEAALRSPKLELSLAAKLSEEGSSDAIIILNDNSEGSRASVLAILGSGRAIRVYSNIPYIYAELDLIVLPHLVSLGSVYKIVPNIVFKKLTLGGFTLVDYRKMQASIEVPAIVNWGLFRTGAVAVWRELNITGSGVVIAMLDTGVNNNHPLIGGKMFTLNASDPSYPGGWIEFDSKGRPVCSSPHDTDGHGSWVTSIAVGGDTRNLLIGYAPGALYIHALVLPTGSGTFAQVLAGLDWAADPYTCNGTKVSQILGRPFRPDIVSMSFGSEGNYSSYLLPAVRALLSLGIIPVAAIGNGGIYTSSNPGNIWGVFGVGSLERDDSVSLFSSGEIVEWPDPPNAWPFKGAYPREYHKPDFVAPGVMIPGAYLSEDLLAIGSGTSASAPALAGIIALGLQASRSRGMVFSPAELYDLLSDAAQSYGVGGVGMERIRYGNGAINAIAFLSSILGYRLRTIAGSTPQTEYSVGTPGSYTMQGFRGSFIAYIDDQRYMGSGGSVSFVIPPSDYGYHYIHVFSLEGGVYSYGKFKVGPSIRASGSFSSGGELFLRLDGFPAVETVIVRYTGTATPSTEGNIIAIAFPNLRGRVDLSVRLPYVDTQQRVSIVASDLIGLIGSSIGLTIYPPEAVQASALSNHVQLLVSGPQTAPVGSRVAFDIYPFSGGRNIQGNISVFIYYIGSLNSTPELLLKVERRMVSYTRVEVETNRTGLYLLWVNASALDRVGGLQARLEGSAVYSVRVLPRDELSMVEELYRNISTMMLEISNINSSLLSIVASTAALRDSYLDLASRYSILYRSVESLSRELNDTRRSIASLQEALRASTEEVSNIRAMFYIAVAVMVLTALGIYITSQRARIGSRGT